MSRDRTPLARLLPRVSGPAWIVGVLMAGGYSRQQCHCKFRPVRATAAGPGRSAAGTGEGEAECTRDAGAACLNLLGRARSIRRDRYGGLCIAAAEILCIEMAGASPAMTIPCERSVPY
jgi:hypothetical protein